MNETEILAKTKLQNTLEVAKADSEAARLLRSNASSTFFGRRFRRISSGELWTKDGAQAWECTSDQ
jgi:hypothetical protein